MQLQLSVSPVSCHNSIDGLASVTSVNGFAPFSYQWQDGQTDSIITNLSAGTYMVTVFDVFGCEGETTFLMPGPEALSLQAVTSDVQCFGAANGMAEVSVEGGTPGYQFLWNTADGNSY